MKLPVHGFQPLLVHVRINLRRRNIGVAQHFLDNAKIGAVPEQMGRETVAQKVRINILLQSCAPRVFFHDLPDARRC